MKDEPGAGARLAGITNSDAARSGGPGTSLSQARIEIVAVGGVGWGATGRGVVGHLASYRTDEPLSSLDAKLRAELRLELKRIQRELGATILYVTHDQIEAMTMADRIGVMNEGVLIQ